MTDPSSRGRGGVVLASMGIEPSTLQVALSLASDRCLRRWVVPAAVTATGGFLTRTARSCSRAFNDLVSNRTVPDSLGGYLEVYPFFEMARLAAHRLGLDPLASDRLWERGERQFDAYVAGRWAGRVPCLYGSENTTVVSFRRQKDSGGDNLLWQVIAHYRTTRRVFEETTDQFPELLTPYYRHLRRQADRRDALKEKQIRLADLILANSDYVRRTFLDAGVPAHKVHAVPTACPPVSPSAQPPAPGGPFIFLSAGTQSTRKGSHLLLRAWRRLGARAGAELWLVGNQELPERLLKDLPAGVRLMPRLPQSQLVQLFRRVSVLVLPTLCEGRANIILQAAANGLPVITTPNSGCEDVVRDGGNGWIVPANDVETLADRMAWCLGHPAQVREMGAASLERARQWQLPDFMRRHTRVMHDHYFARRAAV